MSQAKDPVCGRVVEISAAAGRMTYESQEVYFCSDECRRAFEGNPKGFVAPKFGSAASGGLEYEATPERHGEKPARRKK
jgi:YHS domain-containing protein